MSLEDDETRELPPLGRCYGKLDLAMSFAIGLILGGFAGRIAIEWYRSLH